MGSLSMTDRVENTLREYLIENGFKPGDSLPNENEIAQRLDVSRNIVREALSRLRMLGMVESRTKRGMVMSQPDLLIGLEKVMSPSILSQDNLKDIFELRLILEMGIAEFIFARKTAADIKELEAIVTRQEKADSLTKEDEIEFHGKLYEMTGNDTFKRFQTLLFPIFDHVFKEYNGENGHALTPSSVSHHDLLTVIKNGTADEFRKTMHLHLAPYFKQSLIE